MSFGLGLQMSGLIHEGTEAAIHLTLLLSFAINIPSIWPGAASSYKWKWVVGHRREKWIDSFLPP